MCMSRRAFDSVVMRKGKLTKTYDKKKAAVRSMIIRIRPPQEMSFWGSISHVPRGKKVTLACEQDSLDFLIPKSFDQRINSGKHNP